MRGLGTAVKAVRAELALLAATAVADAIISSVKAAATFELSMARVEAVTKLAGKSFEELEKTALKLGKE